MLQELPIAPGAHIVVRNAVWRVIQVNRTSSGTASWHVIGLSEIVRDQEAIFLEDYEPAVQVLDPSQTRLALDTSSGHRASLVYIESLLRNVPPTGPELHIGNRAAMNVMPYQLEPAATALRKPRQRILIADAVGLGKTLEAGILMAELIRRGRGRRILVATVKSMLTQFQKEMWCRFTIPLVRLDSVGLERIREQIPTNHNPFYHYDKVIISIDTLKQNNAFRTHVERAYWDIIVIDEAHNVAARGEKRAQRNKIAELLAERSDTLILLSATPHDGKAKSFASLMNMLDPTAIADEENYTPEDIEGLFVRRFKRHVQNQVGKDFPERVIRKAYAPASPAEELAFECLAALRFARIDQRANGNMLFKTMLEKSLLSSPAACAQTISERITRLSARDDAADYHADVTQLTQLLQAVQAIDADSFAKYQTLLKIFREKRNGIGWSAKNTNDRLVIFSERIETLHFLEQNLTHDLELKPEQVCLLHGGLPDTEQQQIVEDFGKQSAKVRLLLASDVAAEGLNLHYLCHKLIHFDVPWSLMIFQQRNGRIDRYGQERTPTILYLLTESKHPDIRGDARILERLIEREDQASKNIGDPASLMGVYDIGKEELVTAHAIEQRMSPEAFDKSLGTSNQDIDPLELLLGNAQDSAAPVSVHTAESLSLFKSDFDYATTALEWLRETQRKQAQQGSAWGSQANHIDPVSFTARLEDQVIELTMPDDLMRRFRKLPPEILPRDKVAVLTPNIDAMQRAIADARREETTWPGLHYLWPLHPIMQWLGDKARAAFGRQTAPVITLSEGMEPDHVAVIVSGLLPNRRSQPLLHRWYAVHFRGGAFHSLRSFANFVTRTGLRSKALPNRPAPVDLQALEALVPAAVDRVRLAMLDERDLYESRTRVELDNELNRLEALRQRQLRVLEDTSAMPHPERGRRMRRIERIFQHYREWMRDSMTTEPAPYLEIIAVFRAEQGR